MYKVAIVEDDPLSQQMLKDLIEADFGNYEVCAVCDNVNEAVKAITAGPVDLVMLDMELGDEQGFDVLKRLEPINFEVIITTIHDSYMLQAIKHSALDYLMKPLTSAALAGTLHRFEQRMAKRISRKEAADNQLLRFNKLVIPHQGGLVLVDMTDIVRMEADGAYTKIFLSSGQMHHTSKNLKYYEEKLSAHLFFRVHHTALIHLIHVQHYVKGEGGHVVMSDGSSVDVSRRRKEQFMLQLGI